MKIDKIILLCITMVFVSNTNVKDDYYKIIIKYVDYRFVTPYKIDCENFEGYFQSKLRIVEFTDKNVLDSLSFFMNNLLLSNNSYTPDVRLKIIFVKENRIDTFCTNGWISILNGVPMQRSKDLMDYIERIKLRSR